MCCKDAESRVFSLDLRLKVFMTIFAPDERLPTSATLSMTKDVYCKIDLIRASCCKIDGVLCVCNRSS